MYVREQIKMGWSPEQISGRIKKDKPGLKTNYESIYQYIYKVEQNLIGCLARRHRRRKKRGLKKERRIGKIPDRVSIEDRPKIVDERSEFGHWEIDTVVSRESKACLMVAVERKSRFMIIRKLNDKSTKEMMDKAIEFFKTLPENMRKTITFDNGTENAGHMRLKDELNMDTYFCRPYHSWEKGTVENSIGLIRRQCPKKTNFAYVSIEELDKLEKQINNRPRKCLNYMTP
ncbi:IS30 family transposase ISMae39 [Methanimicrococcus hongohii]|uniref:IS30 family transposase ISMae39 n=1 Tax=Methanimicrococcus hongohii TaxID=3028295 RepID=A0AA96UYZ4_9EURY|nr:IS30 family transposase ISMae39 [Methanimicrococcus sp. Hf6]WNY23259.1 IS30 family transposase ISMae39 [Methanimicrococcus sp. Hf6]